MNDAIYKFKRYEDKREDINGYLFIKSKTAPTTQAVVRAVFHAETILFDNEIILLCPIAEKPCATGVFDKKRTKVAIPMVS